MKITIAGERAEGKTTLAVLLKEFLASKGYRVTLKDSCGERHLPTFDAERQLDIRNVDIVTDDSIQQAWDGTVRVGPDYRVAMR